MNSLNQSECIISEKSTSLIYFEISLLDWLEAVPLRTFCLRSYLNVDLSSQCFHCLPFGWMLPLCVFFTVTILAELEDSSLGLELVAA